MNEKARKDRSSLLAFSVLFEVRVQQGIHRFVPLGVRLFDHMAAADHQFQLAGFDKQRLFYTQGDYGLWQCSKPCHQETYDNEETVRKMFAEQRDMRIPTELVPRCPRCGCPMAMNLRCDDTFVQDAGWYAAARRYEDFLRRHSGRRLLFLELGVGGNTPGIIKYPFWKMTLENRSAAYACINQKESYIPPEIRGRSVCIPADIGHILKRLTLLEH